MLCCCGSFLIFTGGYHVTEVCICCVLAKILENMKVRMSAYRYSMQCTYCAQSGLVFLSIMILHKCLLPIPALIRFHILKKKVDLRLFYNQEAVGSRSEERKEHQCSRYW